MNNKTYSINEVTEMLNLSVKAVRKLVASRKIVTTKVNNTYRIEKEYFEQNKDNILKESEKIEYDLFGEIVEHKVKQSVTKKVDIVNWADI